MRIGRKRVAWLMRGCTRRDPAAEPHPDLVRRAFIADAPDRLWCMDVTQHRTAEGWVY